MNTKKLRHNQFYKKTDLDDVSIETKIIKLELKRTHLNKRKSCS